MPWQMEVLHLPVTLSMQKMIGLLLLKPLTPKYLLPPRYYSAKQVSSPPLKHMCELVMNNVLKTIHSRIAVNI